LGYHIRSHLIVQGDQGIIAQRCSFERMGTFYLLMSLGKEKAKVNRFLWAILWKRDFQGEAVQGQPSAVGYRPSAGKRRCTVTVSGFCRMSGTSPSFLLGNRNRADIKAEPGTHISFHCALGYRPSAVDRKVTMQGGGVRFLHGVRHVTEFSSQQTHTKPEPGTHI
jgi:hypothetical protein